jgi:peroxiredoxin
VILKISIKEKKEAVREYSEEFHIQFPILFDNTSVANSYGVWSHPATFFVNRKGLIVGRAIGQRNWTAKINTKYIEDLLNGAK